MALPIYLGLGMVSIYGLGTTTSMNSFTVSPNQFKFGTIYQIADNVTNYFVGDRAMFKATDINCVVTTAGGVKYTIVEQGKLLFTEY